MEAIFVIYLYGVYVRSAVLRIHYIIKYAFTALIFCLCSVRLHLRWTQYLFLFCLGVLLKYIVSRNYAEQQFHDFSILNGLCKHESVQQIKILQLFCPLIICSPFHHTSSLHHVEHGKILQSLFMSILQWTCQKVDTFFTYYG